jgi:hypothetical protein
MEIIALRHQVAVYRRRPARARLRPSDRLFWAWLSRVWTGWRESLVIVQPRAVIAWQRRRFRDHWRRLSRPGRPTVSPEIRHLIRRMSSANPLWGAPRIVGELRKVGIDVAKSTVERYMVRRPRPASPTWKAFLRNHVKDLVSIDFFVVPTVQFRRRVRNIGIQEILISHQSPWQNPCVERLIGSIRRECLDHVIVLGEGHLRKLLQRYFDDYHRSRTHLSLEMDAPDGRSVQPPSFGEVIGLPEVGGLHQRYERRAA